MIIPDVRQGSEEWMDARVSIPTASIFDKLITSKGALSTSRAKILYQLAGERLLGAKEETYQNAAMTRGIELEGEARLLFQMMTGLEVREVGLCYYDKRKDRACSPDGLIGETEGLEIKCPSLAVHIEYLIANKVPTKYFSQIQGSLYITGYERWHFFSYYPGIKPLHIIVERDEIWIAKLGKILDEFVIELDKTFNQLKAV